MNPRRRLALRLKARAARELINEVEAENTETTTEENSPAKIIPSYDGKAETIIDERKAENTATVKAKVSPSIKTKTAKTTKAKKATPAPKTRKTKTTKKTS